VISVDSTVVLHYAGTPEAAVELAEMLRDQGFAVSWTAVGEDLMAFEARGERHDDCALSELQQRLPWTSSAAS